MNKKVKIGILGCGTIGSQLAAFIARKAKKHYRLAAVCDVHTRKARELIQRLKVRVPVLTFTATLDRSDIVIEAASIACAKKLIPYARRKKKPVIILSVGAFIKYPELLRSALGKESCVHIPSGAISGVDGIASLGMARIKKLRLVTSKPPASLSNVAYLENRGIDVRRIKKDTVVFSGTIKEAITHFPQNINVAATLFLASRFKRIEVVIRVNPRTKRNVHHIEMESDAGRLTVCVENKPSAANPKTSAMTILSTEHLLNKFVANMKVGS